MKSCETCGACCKGWPIGLDESDNIPEHMVYKPRNEMLLVKVDGVNQCVALGPDNRCTIYENRPKTCRNFKRGSLNCQAALASPDGHNRIWKLHELGLLW